MAPKAGSAEAKKKEADAQHLDPDVHHEYEFGGPVGTAAMMLGFPLLLYYLYVCLVAFDGWPQYPRSLSDVQPFFSNFYQLSKKHAALDGPGATIYLGLFAFQWAIAVVLPGYQQEGLPIPSLKGKRLMYNCNALNAFHVTNLALLVLHCTGLFRLSQLIDHFGAIMTTSIIVSFAVSSVCYFGATLFGLGRPIRMSGNPIYDFFMGATLNPRLLGVDIKMWAEVRIPWQFLYMIAIGGCVRQYEQHGYVTPNMAFMVMASGFQFHACAKGEECIPQTWDMAHEKFGWLLAFWNFSGVPFSYCYSIIWMTMHDPEEYRFSTATYALLFGSHIVAHYIFDTAMAQKSHFKMQMQGQTEFRQVFPQLPWNTVHNPKYLQCENGGKLLVDGWWAYLRKPNYSADIVQVFGWSLCIGFPNPVVYWYPFFFAVMIVHRVGRDFARCARKYGKDWDRYCEEVPYIFVPYIF